MNEEDVLKLLKVAKKSKINAYAVGIGLIAMGIAYAILGVGAVVLEIIITGAVLIVIGLSMSLNGSLKAGLVSIALGVIFIVLVEVMEVLHGIEMILEFGSITVGSFVIAFRREPGSSARFTALLTGIAAGIVAILLILVHETTMDFLMGLSGLVLIGIGAYLIWATAYSKQFTLFQKKEE